MGGAAATLPLMEPIPLILCEKMRVVLQLRKTTIAALIILAAVVSLQASGCAAQKSLISQSLNRLDQYTAFYNPFRCQEILYLHDQLVIFLSKTINARTFTGQNGPKESQNNKVTKGLNSFSLPALINSSPAAEAAYFYLADDDINMFKLLNITEVICCLVK